MIKANELRIGNLVLYGTDFCEIKTIGNYQAQISIPDAMPTERDFEDLEPMPLTEEWLLRFGFNRDRGGWHMGSPYYLYNPLTNDNLPSSKYYSLMADDKIISIKALQYVHQLQNLYFALTSNELTTTP